MHSLAQATMRAVALLLVAARALADQKSLDCPLRQIGLDYAQALQPFRPAAAFSEIADALNGAIEAQNCSVAPSVPSLLGARRVLSFPLPKSGLVYFVDAATGDDGAAGTLGAPFASLPRALEAVREARAAAGVRRAAEAPMATLVLRGGSFHLGSTGTLQLTPADSRVTFQAYPGESVFITGGVPIRGATWTPAAPPARDAYEFRPGTLADGFDAAPPQTMTIAAARTLCDSLATCAGFSYASGDPNPSGAVACAFKYNIFWSASGASSSSVYVKNAGYAAGAAPSLYVADLTGIVDARDIGGLRVGGTRMIRARYPNSPTVELQGAMQIVANHWTAQPMGTNANYTFSPASPSRSDSAQGFFQQFKLGIGGPCAFRFTPQAGYWCAAGTQGGGPGPYQAPVGMTVSNAPSSLPHTPYLGNVSRALVHSWRAGRWFSWVFRADGYAFDAATNQSVFNFSLTEGGNQGSRGGNAGQEFFIENVLEELDSPAEFFYDEVTHKLYLWVNSTAAAPAPPPADDDAVAALLPIIINATGTQADPVVDVGFLGLGFRDAAPHFMGPHGTPSGGDWAVNRAAALFFEGTVGVLIDGCLLTTLDGNGVFFSGYARNATVQRSEFVGIGETAISQWGYTDGSPVPGMGFDATAGNQPRGTQVLYNLVHEVGLFTKQNSFYFQSESFGNTLHGNIAYNGPRAGINFDDGMGGGSVVSNNVVFNMCRESSDHGPFNSWNRQVYLVDGPDGVPTTAKLNDTIKHNWMLANYHSSMAIDNDDGSAYYDTYENVFISASEGAAYGGNSLKSDFGGHDNYHHDNLDLFWSAGFGICPAIDGHADGYYNNVLYIAKDGNYGGGQACKAPGMTTVYNNTVFSPTGAITECGMTLAQWQAAGNDPGTVAKPYPDDSVILAIARNLLGL